MEKDNVIYIALIIVVLGVMAGFYVVFDKIATLSTTVSNMALTLELSKNVQSPAQTAPAPTSSQSTATAQSSVPQPTVSLGINIPTAIIFDAQSSSALLPQATTTIEVENVAKNEDGSLAIDVKAFTSNASSYTAIEMKDLFAVVDLNGENMVPADIRGSFQSMPPKSSVTGRIIFNPAANRNTIILQVGAGDNIKYYEFDFTKKSYKETIIG